MPNSLGNRSATSPREEHAAPRDYTKKTHGSLPSARALKAANSLRIVHIITSIDPNVGGPATVISRLAAAQATQGHHITIISSLKPERREAFERSVAGIPGFHRVELQLAQKEVSVAGLLAPKLWRQLKLAIAPANIVHLHGVWDMILLAAARVAKRQGVPYIVRPCGMLDPWSLAQRAAKKKIALQLVFRRMLEGAAALHVLNQAESDLIAPLTLSTPRQIIPNGVFLEEVRAAFAGDGSEFFRQFPALNGKRYILFLSRLHHKKGLDLLAAAFKQVAADDRSVHLVVAGADYGAKAAFVTDIERAGLSRRVHLVGSLHGAIKYSACRHATCFCLPSRQEGFSLAVTEALACGVPVAISRATHFSEAALAGAGIEFNLNVTEIASALQQLLRTPSAKRRAMGGAGQRLVRESFTWPRVATQSLNLYLDIRKDLDQPAAKSHRWNHAKRALIPALRAAGLGLAWLILGKDIAP